MDVRTLIQQKEAAGARAVYLHTQSPHDFPIVENTGYLLECERQDAQIDERLNALAGMKETDQAAAELLQFVGDHFYAKGILRTLRDIGGIRETTPYSASLATYNRASLLEQDGKFEEARDLFESVLESADAEFWSGAAYHLACIEKQLGNEYLSRRWFESCLRWNPGHKKAREALKLPQVFGEVRPNIFERIGWSGTPKILFVVFGALGDVINAFPVVAGLRRKYPDSEVVWLTLPLYRDLVCKSSASRVEVYEPRGIIPWDWIDKGGFTHVLYPEGNANHQESQDSGRHMIDFMAAKCEVPLSTRRAVVKPGTDNVAEAVRFLKDHQLKAKGYIAASHVGISSRYWPHSKLQSVIKDCGMPVILFGGPKDPEIPGAVHCFGRPFETVIALIQSAAFFIGPDSGVSWLATTTDTPMGVFIDPLRKRSFNVGFKDVLRRDKTNIEEWTIYEEVGEVLNCIPR